jgi:hypothetical protein
MYFRHETFSYTRPKLVSQTQEGDDLPNVSENNRPLGDKISLMYVIFSGAMGTTCVIRTHQRLTWDVEIEVT